MKAIIPTCALVAALAVSASAQDSTVTTKTQVKADDARAVVASGCLQQAPDTKIFTLKGAVVAAGEDLTSRSRVRTDVDKNDTTVRTETRTEVDRDRPVGTSGTMKLYELDPRAGVDLATHVGKQVEISAVMLDAAKGDDDADVRIRTETKVDAENAPDSKVRTETKAELPRGANPRLAVVSVKQLASACAN
jgi:hypothetical protein